MSNPTTALELALKFVTGIEDAVVLPGEIAIPDLEEVRSEIEAALQSLRQRPEVLSGTEVFLRLHDAAKSAGSMSALAREIGITKQALSDVLSSRKEPGPAILRHLKLRKVIRGDVYTPVDVESPAAPRPISERHQRARDMLPRLPKSAPQADAGMGVSP